MNKKKKSASILTGIVILSILLLSINSSIYVNADYPTKRIDFAMCYDAATDRIIAYGGADIDPGLENTKILRLHKVSR